MSTQGPQLPPFLTTVRNSQHVLRVQTDPLLPSPRESGWKRVKSILLFMMATAIMGLTFSAMLGNDPTSIRVPNKELKD